jgi:predicted NodU family carbamoyl transferase
MDYIRPNWENLWIPPNPGDPGSCIGAVLASEKKHIDFNPEVWYNSK